MGKLAYYSNLKEKDNKFIKCFTINTKNDFNDFYSQITDQLNENMGKMFFRGVNEAKKKLYNSSQRAWITKELEKWGLDYFTIIENTVIEAKLWCNSLLVKFYQSFGRKALDIPVLSFLQHYGAPTPLLDWTFSFDNSLFFAINGMKYNESDTDIDNYFSIYIILKDENSGKNIELMDIRHIYNSSSSKLHSKFPFAVSEEIKDKVLYQKRLSNRYINAIKSLEKEIKLFFISDFVRDGNKMNLIPGSRYTNLRTLYSNTNFNIINQQGLFIFNSDPKKPIEDLITGSLLDGNKFFSTKINCANIHKSLYEYVKKILEDKEINKDFIYPQEEKLATDAFKKFLEK